MELSPEDIQVVELLLANSKKVIWTPTTKMHIKAFEKRLRMHKLGLSDDEAPRRVCACNKPREEPVRAASDELFRGYHSR